MTLKKLICSLLLLALLTTPLLVMAQERLLILAPDEFMGKLAPLERFKDGSVRPTTLLSLAYVYNNYSGKDTPEQIKKCIADYEKKHGVRYVMLVGDCDKFPVRYLCRDATVPKGFQPGDLYYADLYNADKSFNNWDGNGNGLYGQLDGTSANNNLDNINWYPDVIVARVPASNISEVSIFVEKVISYELRTTNSGWFKKALLVTGNWDQDITTKDYIAANYLGGFNVIKHYHTTVWQQYPIDPNDVAGSMDRRAAPMTNYINQGVGFLNHYGHGSIDDFSWVYDKRHLNNLTNTTKLPVVFSCGCSTAEFAPNPPWQDYYDINNNFHGGHAPGANEVVPIPKPIQPGQGAIFNCDREARPEDWLVNRTAGAVAYIGSAGTANPGYPPKLDKPFFEAYHSGKRTLGEVWKHVLNKYINEVFDANGNVKHSEEWHRYAGWNGVVRFMLFGDPTLRIGGAFLSNLSGNVSNTSGGPLMGFGRYRIIGDVTIPAGQTLSADSSLSILFEDGKKIKASGTSPNSGFIVNATYTPPITFLSLSPDPQSDHVIHGIKINGQLRLKNGGEIKLY
ncbi:MAG: hypothetical protein GTN68_43695 [Candidatus Aminicenantes bacterium]|nr:hypothetical protein [Candidatus Aminicenantes bacterium]